MKLTELGVLDLGANAREVLGDSVPSFFYRYVTLFAVSDALGARAQSALFDVGRKVGDQMMVRMPLKGMPDVVEHFRKHGLGILSAERGEEGRVLLHLQECATCHGLPAVGKSLCHFEAGLLTALVRGLVKGTPGATGPLNQQGAILFEEIQCAGLGDSQCTFQATLSQDGVRKLIPPNLTAR